jgi:hypothetical protein
MVRREDAAQVQPEQGVVQDREHDRLLRRHDQQQPTEVQGQVCGDQAELECCQDPCLVPAQPAVQALASLGLVQGPDQYTGRDVGVFVGVVGVGVVAVVFVVPPAAG